MMTAPYCTGFCYFILFYFLLEISIKRLQNKELQILLGMVKTTCPLPTGEGREVELEEEMQLREFEENTHRPCICQVKAAMLLGKVYAMPESL